YVLAPSAFTPAVIPIVLATPKSPLYSSRPVPNTKMNSGLSPGLNRPLWLNGLPAPTTADTVNVALPLTICRSCTFHDQAEPFTPTADVSHVPGASIVVSIVSCKSVVPNFANVMPVALIGAVAPTATT